MSNAASGAVMKLWARQRFGAPIRHHLGVQDPDARAAEHAESVVREHGRSLDEMFRLLDYESAFHQYYLRRLHGWAAIELRRGMSSDEYRASMVRGRFTANAWCSFSTQRPCHGRRVPITVGAERMLKAYYQGAAFLLPAEYEYIVIGGTYPARPVF